MFKTLLFITALITSVAHANESVWIYMYSHEDDTPQRVLEVTDGPDKFEQCEVFRDLLDDSVGRAHPYAFFTCVVPADLEKGVSL